MSAPIIMRAALHAAPLDARRGVVRVHPSVLSLLAAKPWEPVALTGRRTTGALVAMADLDADPGLLFMDELVLSNVGVRAGDQVTIAPAVVAPAASVVLGGLPPDVGDVDVATLRMALLGALAREAAMNAMRESMAAPRVTAAHFAAARKTVRPSIRA